MITNHHWGSTTKVGGSGANLRFTPYNVPLSVDKVNLDLGLRCVVQPAFEAPSKCALRLSLPIRLADIF